MTPLLAGAFATLLYLGAAALQARHTLAPAPTGSTPERAPGRSMPKSAALMVVAAVVLHGFVSYQLIFADSGINLGMMPVATLVTLIMAAFVTVANLWLPVASLVLFIAPLSALAIIGALSITSTVSPLNQFAPPLAAHIFVSITAYSLLMMAACQSLLLAYQEKRLRMHQALLVRLLPPLETMEHLLFTILWVGLIALTLAIVTGFVFLTDMFAQHVVHHTVLTSLSWVAYAILLAGRHLLGWRSTTAVRWTLGASLLLLLGYFGSKFVMEFLLN